MFILQREGGHPMVIRTSKSKFVLCSEDNFSNLRKLLRKGTGLKEIAAREPVCLHLLITFTWDSKDLEKEKLSWFKKYHSTPYFVKAFITKRKKKHLALRHEFYFAVALKYHTLSCFGKSVWIVYGMSVLWLHKPWVACCAVLASIPPSLCKFLV